MNSENNYNQTSRNPLVAFILSLPVAGLGHLYCGRLNKGMLLFFLSFAFAPVVLLTAVGSRSSYLLIIITIGTILFRIVVSLYAIIDATLLAKRIRPPYRLQEYNKWYVYLLFIAVSLFGSISLDMDIKTHIVQAFKVPSGSMIPNVVPKDYVWANKAIYKTRPVQVGDLVIFVYPNDRSKYFFKRVVALPGDTVEMIDNHLYINDQPLAYAPIDRKSMKNLESYLKGDLLFEKNRKASYKIMLTRKDGKTANFEKITIPNGHCFVMGDNRNNSNDSRQFGPVPLADIMGRVEFIYWPATDWSRFGRYQE